MAQGNKPKNDSLKTQKKLKRAVKNNEDFLLSQKAIQESIKLEKEKKKVKKVKKAQEKKQKMSSWIKKLLMK